MVGLTAQPNGFPVMVQLAGPAGTGPTERVDGPTRLVSVKQSTPGPLVAARSVMNARLMLSRKALRSWPAVAGGAGPVTTPLVGLTPSLNSQYQSTPLPSPTMQ